jgi:hypothetical protein
MIFARAAVAAVVAAGLVVLLGSGGPDPGVALRAGHLVATHAGEADAALAELETALADALADGREGVARTATGTEPPGPSFLAAAERLDAAGATVERADRAVRALGAARVAALPDVPAIDATIRQSDVAAMAIELRTLAASADGFVGLRRRAEGLNELLATALARTEAGDHVGAEAAVAAARTDYDAVAAWESGLASMPVWLETTGELLDATEHLVAAAAAGDAPAVAAAADRIAALEEDAVFADRALRIAMSEGASFAAEGPMAALAEAERRTIDTRAQVVSILQTVAR